VSVEKKHIRLMTEDGTLQREVLLHW